MKLVDLTTKQRSYRYLIVPILAATVFTISAFGGRIFVAQAQEEVPIQQVEGVSDLVALTFDVTHGQSKIKELMAILEGERVQATFFVGGTFLNLYPQTVRDMSLKGHEIGTLGQLIVDLSALPEAEVTSNLLGSQSVLTKAIGGPVRYFRPPYGPASPSVIRAAQAAGMWTVTATNAGTVSLGSADALIHHLRRTVRGGAIIRLAASDWAPETIQALPKILSIFKEKGLRPVPLGQMR